MVNKIKKFTYISIGVLLTIIGIIGAFLPILPTTPFLLAAVYFFSKSSDKLQNWILNHKKFGPPIKQYYLYKKLDKKIKIKAYLLLWLSIIISSIALYPRYIHIFILFAIAILVTIKIYSIPS